MVTSTWCGTNYAEFQSTCEKCGASLPLPEESALDEALEAAQDALRPAAQERLVVPPPAPRSVPGTVTWRIMGSDGWAIVGIVFGFIGAVFTIVGAGLTVGVVTAFVGIPFLLLGLVFLGFGGGALVWRYRLARDTVEVLRHGQPVLGRIESVHQNYNVRVNGRHPWTIEYRYDVDGRALAGKVTTLSQPDLSRQPGKQVYVLFMADEPEQNSIFPNPYGYYGV